MQPFLLPFLKDFSPRSGLLAGAILIAAIFIRLVIDAAMPGTPPFITLYPAVALTAVFCGPLAGAGAGAIGALTAMFLWLPPPLSFSVASPVDRVSLSLFLAASSIVLWAAGTLRAQRSQASVARSALDLGLTAGGVGTWEINLRTRQIIASATARRMHDMPDGAAGTRAEDWLRGVHPDDLAAARETLHAAIVNGTTASYIYRIFGSADHPRWISARGRVVVTDGERRLLCALVDVTDQIRVQDELKRERERLRLALEAGHLAVWDHDLATMELTCDARYAAIMGFPPDARALTREQVAERIHPEDLPRVGAEHDATVASGAGYHIEFRIITPTHQVRWMASKAILIKGDLPSDPGRLVGIIQDITDQKQRERDLQAVAAAREMLIREADHRIKNSLQLVVALLTVQLRGITDLAAAAALRGAITRVGAIAASHLALQSSEDFKQLDLSVTLRELCAHFAALEPAVAIVCRDSGPLMLDADRAIPLALAVSELLTNALRHAFQGRDAGSVVVETLTDDADLIVRISDDGVGMPPRSERDGLGSRIIRSLATQLAASIQVRSTPSVGTIVDLRLPLAPETSVRQAIACCNAPTGDSEP